MFPNRSQWRRWSLPSKYAAVGVLVGLVGVSIALLGYLAPTPAGGPVNDASSISDPISDAAARSRLRVITAHKLAMVAGGNYVSESFPNGVSPGGAGRNRFVGVGKCDSLLDGSAVPLRFYVEFDLATIPPGAQVTRTTLLMPSRSRTYPKDPYPSFWNSNLEVVAIAEAWEEGSLTWRTTPALNKSIAMLTTLHRRGWNPLEFDVANLASYWVDFPEKNFGAYVSAPDYEATASNACIIFAGRQQFKLYVRYEVP